jgi:hypothetical protein
VVVGKVETMAMIGINPKGSDTRVMREVGGGWASMLPFTAMEMVALFRGRYGDAIAPFKGTLSSG